MTKQKFIPGVTIIGKVNIIYGEQKCQLDLYYGNLINYEDKKLMISEDEYIDIFNDFISSSEVSEKYIIPDEDEFFQDIDNLHKQQPEKDEDILVEIEPEQTSIESEFNNIRFYKITSFILLILTICLLVWLCVGVYLYKTKLMEISDADSDTFSVVVLANDIQKGDIFSKDNLVEEKILKEDYMDERYYIDAEGNQKEDKMILYANKESLIGKYATEDIKQGQYVYTSSVSPIINNKENIQLQLDDGTTVSLQANELENGNSNMHLYAIITTNEENQIINTAVDLGEIKFEGKVLTDILNQQGVSILSNE